MKYSYNPPGRGNPILFSAHITDVIIKAGVAQYSPRFDWHRTPITSLVGFYQIIFFFSFNPEDPSLLWYNLESPGSDRLTQEKKMASCKKRLIVATPVVGDAQQLVDNIRLPSE